MIKDRICKYCNVNFFSIEGKIFSNHVKWCDKNPSSPRNNIIVCDKCGESYNNLFRDIHKCNIESCFQCNKKFKQADNRQRFCSHSCSAKYYNLQRIKDGISNKGYVFEKENRICSKCNSNFIVSKNVPFKNCNNCRSISKIGNKYHTMLHSKCVICNGITTYKKGCKIKKTCSTECYRKHMSNLSIINPKCGGDTNYKRYYYKNILMDSKWEVQVAELMDSLNIEWIRSKKLCLWWFDGDNRKRRYHPDFYLPKYDYYLDTKNKYLMIKDEYKIKKVLENNKVNLLVGVLETIKDFILKLPSNNLTKIDTQ